MTPKQIVERHKQYPGATEELIAAFGYQCYLQAIKDLTGDFTGSCVSEMPEQGLTIIVLTDTHLKDWKSGARCQYKYRNYESANT
jgi:hypothetical protein